MYMCSHFILFCSLISVSKKWNIETTLTFPYSFNWQKFDSNHKMNEKRSQEYQSLDPEYYVRGQINSRILELLLIRFCCSIFAPKILICFSLIKHFPNDYKRYSSHLQVSMLHRVAPIKVFVP